MVRDATDPDWCSVEVKKPRIFRSFTGGCPIGPTAFAGSVVVTYISHTLKGGAVCSRFPRCLGSVENCPSGFGKGIHDNGQLPNVTYRILNCGSRSMAARCDVAELALNRVFACFNKERENSKNTKP